MSSSSNTPTVAYGKASKGNNLFDMSKKPSHAGETAMIATTDYSQDADDGKTVLYQPLSEESKTDPKQSFMTNAVVGWVVIVAGPGKGLSLPLGYGANTLGRNKNQRVVLDFGDQQISRECHCIIIYEPKKRLFYLQNGNSVNLTYLGYGEDCIPVLMPVMLENGQFIQVGQTTLKFMALCGTDFDWNDFSA